MAWIFQGNPDRYDIDNYISQSPDYIYWHTPRYYHEIAINETVFIWRAGNNSGVIAIGKVAESPVAANEVQYPDLLGRNFWIEENAADTDFKTGVSLEEVRLDESNGMIQRKTILENTILRANPIITLPRGTVFKLNSEETEELVRLWESNSKIETNGELEGNRRLRHHYVIERSRSLRNVKLNRFRAEFGELRCELCGIKDNGNYPVQFSESIFEVHHRKPLSSFSESTRTRIEDLAVLCSNCHRAVHRNNEVEQNYQILSDYFAGRKCN